MTPDRKKTINGYKIEEYYWAEKMVVYIDNRVTEETFEEACKRIAKELKK